MWVVGSVSVESSPVVGGSASWCGGLFVFGSTCVRRVGTWSWTSSPPCVAGVVGASLSLSAACAARGGGASPRRAHAKWVFATIL
eukprot:11541144-Prorocentrum_lima.AAC.1